LYCSVQELEARRNHEELIWSKKEGFAQPFEGEKTKADFVEENIVMDKEEK